MRRDPAAIIMYAKKARRSKPKRSPKNSVGEQKTKQKRHKKSAVMGIASTPNILGQRLKGQHNDTSSTCVSSKLLTGSKKNNIGNQDRRGTEDSSNYVYLSPPDLAAGWSNRRTNSSSSNTEPSLTKVWDYVSGVNLREREKGVCFQ